MQIGAKWFDIGSRTFIVGILNVTPDSFSDGGRYTTVESAAAKAAQMVADGADMVEIGGESSRPGHVKIGAEQEMERVLPVLQALRKEIDVPIAVDTYKASVAEAALQHGAAVINDVHRFRLDPGLAAVCAKFNAVCCVMHNRGDTNYGDFLRDVAEDLKDSTDMLIRTGVDPGRIIVDPGVGFAKSAEQNLEVLRNVNMFAKVLPFPVMIGTSRKSFMGKVLGLELDRRLEATIATTVLAVQQGCAFVRVHDVPENKRAAMMADVLVRGG